MNVCNCVCCRDYEQFEKGETDYGSEKRYADKKKNTTKHHVSQASYYNGNWRIGKLLLRTEMLLNNINKQNCGDIKYPLETYAEFDIKAKKITMLPSYTSR